MSKTNNQTKQVTVYSKYNCRFCDLTKDFLAEHKVAFTEHNIEEEPAARDQVIAMGAMGVPVIDVDGQIVVGFDKPRLSELIGV